MVIQLLGMMCGAAADPVGVSDCGFFLFVVNPDLLTSPENYRERVGAYAESLRTTRPLDPAKPVRMPFERSAAERERRRAGDAVEVPDATFAALTALAEAPASPQIDAAGGSGSTAAINGAWNLVVKSPMGDQASVLTVTAQGRAVTGEMAGAGGRSEVEHGRLDGERVSWLARITTPMPLTLEFSGKVQGDRLDGSVKLGAFGSAPFTGERAPT